jgi:hypothetical protein
VVPNRPHVPLEELTQPRLRTASKSVAGKVIREHPTLVLTLAYLGLTAIGMIHDLWFYRYFQINILDYSETGDFLLAAMRNPLVIVLSMLPLAILIFFAKLREFFLRRSESYRAHAAKYVGTKWNSVGMRAFIYFWFIFVYAVLFTQLYAFREVTRVKEGRGKRVALTRTDGSTAGEKPIFLGSTAKFFFLYYPDRRETEIVPVENTTMVTVDSRRRREKRADSAAAASGDTAAARRMLRR